MNMIMQLDESMANSQLKLIAECKELLDSCEKASESLREGQTSLIWTADGKSVALAEVLTSKYNASVKWLKDIRKEVDEAAVNLDKAIKETKLLDEQSKDAFSAQLVSVVGTIGHYKPMPI
ncbi:hypothetical protein MIAR_22470 [Microbacterium arabinogalactanolyticum]|uniref:hypothetical protein n=2 Tax=Microbacterium arabinogalactanolyticum TaxID=69365 RepID=UPI0031DFBFE3|nr:hypothetical protein MIAR_22470 [Microbacterium arabinogalactanolyticum]